MLINFGNNQVVGRTLTHEIIKITDETLEITYNSRVYKTLVKDAIFAMAIYTDSLSIWFSIERVLNTNHIDHAATMDHICHRFPTMFENKPTFDSVTGRYDGNIYIVVKAAKKYDDNKWVINNIKF